MKVNLHTHSVWCDGQSTTEETARTAISKGFAVLGFSSHAMLPGDPLDWPLTAARLPAYVAEVRALAERFAGQIRILCGVEADWLPGASAPERALYAPHGIDYLIGSVHFVRAPDGFPVPVDHTPELLAEGIRGHFAGDARAFVEAYFAAEREMAAACDFDFIGHPDLCRKFNAKCPWFDENAAWYRAELVRTADAFAASGKCVEVNTGAIARGWLDDAYPSPEFRALLRARGVRFILSSDAHAAETLDCAFDRFAAAEEFAEPRFLTLARSAEA